MTTRRLDRARGFSILETLIFIVILLVILIPLTRQFTTAHRVGVSARHLYEATSNAQTLLDTVCNLDTDELPDVPEGSPVTLLEDGGIPAAGGTERWPQVVVWFSSSETPGLIRKIEAEKGDDGSIVLAVSCEWKAIRHDDRTDRQFRITRVMNPPR